jgi:arylsulfatase A-like enzyme
MNVILIIADTVRYGYLGCNGNPWVRTPCLDALAAEAAVMDRFFCGSFPTGPMRKDVHAGRYTFPYQSWQDAPPEGEVLLARWLSGHGVHTAYVGDTDNSPQYRQGFADEVVVSHKPSRLDAVPETVPLPADGRKLRYPESYAQRIARDAAGWDGEVDRRAPRTMLEAHRWLEDRANDDTPFFLWVDTFDPHEPWDPPRYYVDLYDPAYEGDELVEPAYEEAAYASAAEIAHMRCLYAAKLTMVDRWIGHLLEGLRLMRRLEDTAIIFTSDHGFYHGEHGYIGKVKLNRKNRIVGRWPLYETIAHVPLMVRVPGLPGGARHDALCQPPDITATILDLLAVPAHGRLQGRSLIPVLRGETDSVRPWAISSATYVTDKNVRAPTSFRDERWLYVYGGDEAPTQLYDTWADPAERLDLLAEREDDAATMHEAYVRSLEELGCPEDSLELRRAFRPAARRNLPIERRI